MFCILRIRLESLSRLSKYMSCIIQDDIPNTRLVYSAVNHADGV